MRYSRLAVVSVALALAAAARSEDSSNKIPVWGAAVDWVVAQGKDKKLDAGWAGALGLAPGLPIRQKGFLTDDKMKHFLQVSTATGHVLVAFQDPSYARPGYMWLTGRDGVLRKTAKNPVAGSVESVSNKEAAEAFAAEKAFWLRKTSSRPVGEPVPSR